MSLIEAILKTVAPHNCLECGQEGKLLCVWCRIEAFDYLPSRCYNCYSATENCSVCAKCRRLSPLKHVWVRTEYDGIAKKLIYAYKFNQARSGAEIIAESLKESMPYAEGFVIVPVGTASIRVRQRGFDHTALMAKHLAQLTSMRYMNTLRRSGQTKQVGTKRNERKNQLKGTFRATGSLEGLKVLLVDDVLTTGATLEEAARACRQAGAKQVNAVVFAQTQ